MRRVLLFACYTAAIGIALILAGWDRLKGSRLGGAVGRSWRAA